MEVDQAQHLVLHVELEEQEDLVVVDLEEIKPQKQEQQELLTLVVVAVVEVFQHLALEQEQVETVDQV